MPAAPGSAGNTREPGMRPGEPGCPGGYGWRTWPRPSTTNFRMVSSLTPMGPKA
jgi:hypothetical protein